MGIDMITRILGIFNAIKFHMKHTDIFKRILSVFNVVDRIGGGGGEVNHSLHLASTSSVRKR